MLLAALLLASPADAGPAAVPAPTPVAPDPAAVLAGLSFLTGHWRGTVGPPGAGIVAEAAYTSSEGGMVLSASRTLQGGKVTSFEFERFAIVDGIVTLTPYPGGNETASFRYVPAESGAAKAVFANPGHDYPTELTYALVGPDHLVITLSGRAAGNPELAFDLRRAP